MDTKPSLSVLIRRPAAFAPIMMSLAAFTIVAGYVLTHGAVRQSDEGAAAHIWQLLVCAQFPLVAFFGIKWLRKAPQAALRVLVLQFLALLVAAAPVFLLHL